MGGRVAALTGATGFLGRAIAQRLRADGYELRVLARPGAPVPFPAQIVHGRLADQEALEQLAGGAELIVHAAGLIKARRPADFGPVNIDGAARMAQAAAARAPDARFVLISSLSARAPQVSPYASSKAAGEAAVRAAISPGRLTIVRPPAIYGPGDRETLALFRAVSRSPVLPAPGPGHARLALIHIEDAAAQIASIAERPAAGQTFALADGRPEGYGWREIAETAGAAVGRAPVLVPTPGAAILAIGWAGSVLGRLGRAQIMTLGKAREALHGDWAVRPGELAPGPPQPRFDLRQGFADAVAWYRAEGWL